MHYQFCSCERSFVFKYYISNTFQKFTKYNKNIFSPVTQILTGLKSTSLLHLVDVFNF